MRVNPAIFKAYDIRGIYPQELDGKTAYLIGAAFGKFLNKKRPAVVIGMDNRLSSRDLHNHLIRGLNCSGASVIDIGLSTTPMLYFAAAHYGFDGGINITASHNTKEYNGFKLVRELATPISGDSGLDQIKQLAEKLEVIFSDSGEEGATKKDVMDDYLSFNLKDINLDSLKPLKIVVDTANAVPGMLVSKLSGKIPCAIKHIFKELDGNFPNHQPDPLQKENLASLCLEVKKSKADLGVAFDGDGDRIIFVDERGEPLPSDSILSLMAELILKSNTGSRILYDIRSSRIVKETIEKNGGVPVIWRVGHSFIKEKMRKDGIVFAGELSGHFYHQNHYFCEVPLFVLLKIIEIISTSGKTFSQLIKPYQKYWHSGEINFEVEDKLGKIAALKKHFVDGSILEMDGLKVDFDDWWFGARASNTEPLLRLVLEAKSQKLLEQKKKELMALISQ